jgi:CBS domain containing-hemolysin-like protein
MTQLKTILVWRDHRFEIIDMDRQRIDKVLVTPESRPS